MKIDFYSYWLHLSAICDHENEISSLGHAGETRYKSIGTLQTISTEHILRNSIHARSNRIDKGDLKQFTFDLMSLLSPIKQLFF